MNRLTASPRRCALTWLLGAMATSVIFALPARAEPAMWVIRDQDSTIYLVGTLHLLRPETEWNSAKVKKAVTESSELWLEVENLDDQAAALPLITQYGMDPEKTLSSKLNATQKEKLAKVAATYGLPLESLDPMRPWMAALTFSILPWMKAGYDPNAGIDHVLKAQAEKEGDKIHGFETAEEQIRFLADLSEPEQIAFLEQTLNDVEKGVTQIEKLTKAWMDGDSDTIATFLVKELKQDAPVLYEKLVVQRNIAWSKKIAEILNGSGVQQIAVGAAHLVGPDSLQVQLAKRGIKAERY
jgi:uncharacterized protein YbaP (TraB family)